MVEMLPSRPAAAVTFSPRCVVSIGRFGRVALLAAMVVSAPPAFAHGTHTALMEAVDEKLADAPEDAALWYQRALLEFEHEDWEDAKLDLDKAERFAPETYPVKWWKGQILDKQGRHEEAMSELDSFLEKTPNHWGALASRARVETQLGLNERALEDYRASLANHPHAEPDLVQEAAGAMARNGLIDEALQTLEAGIARIGPIASLQMKILEIEDEAGRWDSALGRLDRIQRDAVRPEPWMVKRAGLLAAAGRLVECRAAWTGLVAHIKALPPEQRDSHSMTLIHEQANLALTVLASTPAPAAGFASPWQP